MGILDSLAGGIGGGKYVNSFLNPEDAYKAAEEAAQKGWQESKGYQEPFVKYGLDQYGRLNQGINQLLNPQELISQFSSGYEKSPYAQRMLDLNQQSGLDAASQMGLLGSSGALQNIQRGAGDIVSSDRERYMQNLMKTFLSGLGLSGGLYETGAGTARNLGQQATQMGENMAGLAYGRERAPGQLLENLLKLGANTYGQMNQPPPMFFGG